MARPNYTGRLLVDCADRPGIVAGVSGFLFERGANIVSSHQYSSDPVGGRFFLRTEFFLEEDSPSSVSRQELRESFTAEVAGPFQMDWRLRFWGERRRVAILVSRHDHCLMDLLWRQRRGELDAEVVAVLSNHPDLQGEVETAGVPFHHVPVTAEGEAESGDALGNAAKEGGEARGATKQSGEVVGPAASSGRAEAEERMLELLVGRVDVVVLARYMQILSGSFLARVGAPTINIHHSFLPAFPGADPYRRAREHGVKLIGATAHYVTEELDGGPIIEQGVERVDHRMGVEELERVGRDIERVVLARALALHLDDRVLVDGGRTVVF
jgi:formyltetrahydrofolate deformylase